MFDVLSAPDRIQGIVWLACVSTAACSEVEPIGAPRAEVEIAVVRAKRMRDEVRLTLRIGNSGEPVRCNSSWGDIDLSKERLENSAWVAAGDGMLCGNGFDSTVLDTNATVDVETSITGDAPARFGFQFQRIGSDEPIRVWTEPFDPLAVAH